MTMFATGQPVPEPSGTPLSDRIAAGLAALPPAEAESAAYWTTSLDRPTGFVPVDVGRPTPERLAHGLVLALVALPVGVAVAFATGRSGSVAVVSAAGLALGAAVLYRLGARTISRRGAAAVSGVVLLGVLLEVVAVAASETSALPGRRAPGPTGFGAAVVHRLGDPTQTGRYVGAAALLLVVGLAVTAGVLVVLRVDGADEGDPGDQGDQGDPGSSWETTHTPHDVAGAADQTADGTHGLAPDDTHDTHDDTHDAKA